MLIAMILGLTSPTNSNSADTSTGGAISTYDDGPGTGGDTGQLPPPKGG